MAIVVIGVAVRGFVSSLSVFLGVVVGYVFAAILGKVDWSGVHDAARFGLPDLAAPEFQWRAILLIVPAVVLVLLAENAGHVKTVGAMTERDLDGDIGRSFMGDGLATTVSGLFDGSATTTYGENIGVSPSSPRSSSRTASFITGAEHTIDGGGTPGPDRGQAFRTSGMSLRTTSK